MVASHSALEIAPAQVEIPAQLRKVCFAFCAMNLTLCLMADLAHVWIKIGAHCHPTDLISFWAAGGLVLDGFLTQAFDWDILKRRPVIQSALRGIGPPRQQQEV
ncbi:hypothetical protein [Bradyrhizobium sp. JYMT SZCCT0428]|uniref:hypothetical protein n=1 Tax=Bradyrhizobium sp. JYMT SZCCT0428 TaxID=2807673 RepID=UPI001BA57FB7|nr:hypothetical protein [Bradyrhizobium sp. JYMT SZCCT0428]MBR1155275.1 hypothetical protein [Bradyrhizobium sp. JYMT SZCCT0428]